MKVGLVGKPNVGKSTFFAAATLAEAAIGNYPFTTIEPNHGVGYVRVPDPGPDFGVASTPRQGRVVPGRVPVGSHAGGSQAGGAVEIPRDGMVRLVPVDLVDVAGLVPGAHEGKGLGNKFLSDLSQADVLVHVIDATGATDAEGNTVQPGSHDPLQDARFLEEEIDWWIEGILADGWDRVAKRVQMEGRKLESAIAEKLGGIGITEPLAARGLREAGLAGRKPTELKAQGLLALAKALRRASKPMVVALNKADAVAPAQLARLEAAMPPPVVRVSAQAELALQKGVQSGAITYAPGASDFAATAPLNPAQEKGLGYIRDHVLGPLGETGVARTLEAAVFQLLQRVPVFPVEDEAKLTDKDGRVLPDCHLVPPGSTVRQLAYRVHTDLGEHFIRAIDCRTKRAIGADHELKAGDVVKIVAKA